MYVIGNGESRKGIDISKFEGYKVGCNAIMREFDVDYLVCVDTTMVDQALQNGINEKTLVYTRPNWLDRYNQKNIRRVPDLPYKGIERWDDPWNWGSGPYAVLIGCLYAKEGKVNLLGFDLWSNDNRINNIYKGTDGYKDPSSAAVDPRYWIHQIGMLFKCFPKLSFTIYQTDNWQIPAAWKEPNVIVDKISNIR